MGHLALRYRDASRSGVYRVTDAAVPREAAVEAGSILTQIGIANGAALAAARASDFQALVSALQSAAAARRERGTPFYAVLVDPRQILRLPALYKEPGWAE